jgi:putative oxidoreductase
VNGVECLAGALLLVNQFVPLALVVLAAVIANILVYHLTMALATIPMALVVTALWIVVALPLRSHFAPLLVRKVSAS